MLSAVSRVRARPAYIMAGKWYIITATTAIKLTKVDIMYVAYRTTSSFPDTAIPTIINGVNTSRKMEAHIWNRFDTRMRATLGNRERL